MRKVLLRFVFNDFWNWQSVGNEFHVGAGWLVVFWILVAAIAVGINWRVSRNIRQAVLGNLIWLALPVFVMAVPVLQLPFANSGIPVFGYGFMMFVGFSTATLLAARRVQTVGLEADVIHR